MEATGMIQDRNFVARIALDYWEGLKGLTTCPREIWFVYLVKILESLCYFSSTMMLMHFLTYEDGMNLSDVTAGTITGLYSASMSFFMLFSGFIADSLGIKKALIGGLVAALFGRIAITFFTNPFIVFPGLFMLSVAFAGLIPLLAASVKIYSTPKAQRYAFSWYYVVMNIGSLLAGLTLKPIRDFGTETMHFQVAGINLTVIPIQIVFLVSVLTTLVSFVIVIFFIRARVPELETEEAEVSEAKPKTATQEPPQPSPYGERKSPWQIMKEVVIEKRFWIFISFIFLLVLVKMIFQYNHFLYPLYMERINLGDWIGPLYSINPAIIILLVPVMTAITGRMNAFNVIVLGSFLSAGSVLIMGLGEGIVFIATYQVALSIGEAIWSPRLYDYTATIAPKGKEASYMAFSKMPMFFAKVAAGPATGLLLFHLCPEEGARNTQLMWVIVGLSTLVSPITLVLGKKWLDVEGRKRQAVTGGR
ncbi:MAG: MFS transporter [candidate division Zixibacteria bacterium]|nr:MFS transporter [Candidatus Tariuqbacter arcticus]